MLSKQGEGLWNFYHHWNNWLWGYTVFNLLPQQGGKRAGASPTKAALLQPDRLRLSTRTLEVFRYFHNRWKETAISNCTQFKQLFVKGQICGVSRNSQTVLQFFAIKHMEGRLMQGTGWTYAYTETEWSRADTHRNEHNFSDFRRTVVPKFPVQKDSARFAITLGGCFFREFIYSHVGPT